jgi:large subunit ribosomal protein L16
MLMPKRVKYRKVHRGRLKGKAWRGNTVAFGTYGLQAVESHYITSRQIEAARRAIVRYIRRGGKIWIRVFPDKPWTKRAAETRMGSGKGSVEHWVAPVRAGRVMFEMAGVREDQAREAMRLAAFKLPMRTQFIMREEHGASAGQDKDGG